MTEVHRDITIAYLFVQKSVKKNNGNINKNSEKKAFNVYYNR